MLSHLPHPSLPPHTAHPDVRRFKGDVPEITPPAPAASSTNRSHNPLDSVPCWLSNPPKSPSRSSVILGPLLNPIKNRSISPERVSPEEAAEFEATTVVGESEHTRDAGQPGSLASWFNGTSEPVNITLVPSPSKEKADPFFESAEMDRGSARGFVSRENENSTKRPTSRVQKRHSGLAVSTKDSAGSKFAFWRSRSAHPPEKSDVTQDDLTMLDAHKLLFPPGQTEVSPSEDFKNLKSNAENAVQLFRNAYHGNLQSLRESNSEKIVLTDELEAARTQSDHMKQQLGNMADKLATQESATQRIAEELATIRDQMRQDAEFRNRSLRLVTPEASHNAKNTTATDDHGVLSAQRWRRSSDSMSSNHSSSGDSVFSRPDPGTCTPVSIADPSGNNKDCAEAEKVPHERECCRKCPGNGEPSEAWDVVDVLTEENRSLKARIVECEAANEDALSLLKLGGPI